jgi:hypothetical protein
VLIIDPCNCHYEFFHFVHYNIYKMSELKLFIKLSYPHIYLLQLILYIWYIQRLSPVMFTSIGKCELGVQGLVY